MKSNESEVVPPAFKRVVGGKTGMISSLELVLSDRTASGQPMVLVNSADTSQFEYLGGDEPTAAGKGATLRGAATTAIGERLERMAMRLTPARESLEKGTWHEIDEDHTVVDHLPLRALSRGNTRRPEHNQIDEPFSASETCYWVTGRHLVSGDEWYVPAQFVSNDLADELDMPTRWATTSNGFAAGPNLESAIVGSIYELVERDAFMYSWFTRTETRPVDTSGLPSVEELRREFETPVRKLHVFELETPLDVPTVGASFVHTNDQFPKFGIGAAADVDPRAAIRDAIFELAQQIPLNRVIGESNVDQLSVDQSFDNFDENMILYGDPENFEHVKIFTNLGDERDPVRYDDVPTSDLSPREELRLLLAELRDHDCTPITIEKTPCNVADVGVNVVKTVVPELLPLSLPSNPPIEHPRFADESIDVRPHPFP